MLLKRYMNGTPKPLELQEVHCKTCNDGKNFEAEEHIRTREFGWKTDEMSCAGCESKYIVPNTPAKFVTGLSCKDCSHLEGTACTQQNNFLCSGRIPSLLQTFETLKEGLEMNEGLLEQKEEFRRTQKCPEHYWITSEPFTTPKGTFEVENCLVCGIGKMNYEGVEYQDELMKLISFLATDGMKEIKVEKEQMLKREILFKDIGLDKIEQEPDLQISGLFTLTPELPKIEFIL